MCVRVGGVRGGGGVPVKVDGWVALTLKKMILEMRSAPVRRGGSQPSPTICTCPPAFHYHHTPTSIPSPTHIHTHTHTHTHTTHNQPCSLSPCCLPLALCYLIRADLPPPWPLLLTPPLPRSFAPCSPPSFPCSLPAPRSPLLPRSPLHSAPPHAHFPLALYQLPSHLPLAVRLSMPQARRQGYKSIVKLLKDGLPKDEM